MGSPPWFHFLRGIRSSKEAEQRSHKGAYLRGSAEAAGCLPSGPPPPSSQFQEDASCTEDTFRNDAALWTAHTPKIKSN